MGNYSFTIVKPVLLRVPGVAGERIFIFLMKRSFFEGDLSLKKMILKMTQLLLKENEQITAKESRTVG